LRILLLAHRPRSAAEGFHANMCGGLAEAARELGHEVIECAYADPVQATRAEQDALYRLLLDQPCGLAIDLCCWGCGLSGLRVWDGSAEGEFIFDAMDMAYVGLMFDQPWFQPVTAMQASRLYLGASDRHGPEQVALIYPDKALRRTLFVPPAARAANARALPFNDRPIDVLYAGNLRPSALDRPWRGAPDGELCDAAADAALASPDAALHRVVGDTLRQSGREPSPQLILNVLRPVDDFMRNRLRLDAVRAAAAGGVPLHVFGNGWTQAALPDNVVLHSETEDYAGLLVTAGMSKICLDSSSYVGGANDRIFNYAVNRAYCVTNASAFPREVFGDDGGMGFYSMSRLPDLGEALRQALADPAGLAQRAEHAADVALATQTWRCRLEGILAALEG
jgi:hypothetical protein